MSTLYIISTPIGNLEDITLRAVSVLPTLDLLLCEDTRVTKRLLDRYEVNVPTESYREQVHARALTRAVARLKEGASIGLVSDAGTPGISDPGAWLVRDILTELPDTKIIPIPGPSAVTAALAASGFDSNEFVFLGFPPHKKKRQSFFKEALSQERTAVLYESTHRIMKALETIGEMAPDRRLVVCRELTKLHETIYRGTAEEIAKAIQVTSDKGEFVIVIEKKK